MRARFAPCVVRETTTVEQFYIGRIDGTKEIRNALVMCCNYFPMLNQCS